MSVYVQFGTVASTDSKPPICRSSADTATSAQSYSMTRIDPISAFGYGAQGFSGRIKGREMKSFSLFYLHSTGRPASICLQTLGSYSPCSASSAHSFNKRRGETVHTTERPHFAVTRRPRFFGMPLEYLKGPAPFTFTRTLRFSSNIRIQISLADATR